MQLLTAIVVLATACAASPAGPQVQRAAGLQPWVKAKSTDSRSPCPFLNTLANHGYLPHDGRNMTADDIGNAIFAATNWSTDFGTPVAAAALAALNQTTMALHDLDNTLAGEHPGSLTRLDASEGDSNDIDLPRLAEFLADSRTPSNSKVAGEFGPAYLTPASLAVSRVRVEKIAEPALTTAQQGIGTGEAGLLLLLMRDDSLSSLADMAKNVTGLLRAPVDRTAVWLLQERFPTELGWEPSDVEVQTSDLTPVIAAVAADMQLDQNSTGYKGLPHFL